MLDTIVLWNLNLAAWITIVTILALFLSLLLTRISEEVAFLGAIAILGVTGVLSDSEALAGFSSSSVIVVGVLFIVVAGLVHTGVLQWIVKNILGTPKSHSVAIVNLMAPVAALSAFLSNTTVVALFVHVVKKWAVKLGVSPSKLLIPLSYASGMGGVCTIIGTPPNLIISGLYAQESGNTIGFFATTVPGLVCLGVGIISIIAMRRLLPDRPSPEDAFSQTSDYTVELLVPADNPHIGQTINEAGFNRIEGGHLIELIRFDREIISPVHPDEPLMGGDRLVFAGSIEQILSFRTQSGLVSANHPVFTTDDFYKHRKLRTAYVQHGFELLRKPASETTFERDHHLTLVAVASKGNNILKSPRDVRLNVGDTVLLEYASSYSGKEAIEGLSFTDDADSIPETGAKTLVSAIIMIAMVALSSLNVLSLLHSAVLAAAAMLIFRCCTPSQAMRSISWDILLIFAASVVIGNAIEKTGIATALASGVMNLCGSKPLLVMTMMCVVATFVTEFISNTAAGAIFFPIVYHSAISMGCNPLPFMIALMIAVSSSFATPIGSPTHLLVYGAGGYRFSDFLKIGLPMNLIILAANLLIVNLLYPIGG